MNNMKILFGLMLMIAFEVAIGQSPSEKIVQKQVDAYNQRNIDKFMAVYSSDIEVYLFPDSLLMSGKEAMRKHYKAMFEAAPDLSCMIINRIGMGNNVIDREYVKRNGKYLDAIAIYKVEQDSIVRVTFILE
jgi:hypothetical protein